MTYFKQNFFLLLAYQFINAFQGPGDSHWQDRDNHKSNWIPSSHKYYDLEGDVDPEIVKALKKSGKIKSKAEKPRYYQNTNPSER